MGSANYPTSGLSFRHDRYGNRTANNGNVASTLNNRNHNRDLTYTYDQLNRIQTAQSAATSGSDCWGLSFGYDTWANLLFASVTKCSAPMLSLGVNTLNRITNMGFSYDAAGNLLGDGSFSYTWDAESRMKTAAGLTYTYDGDGKRVQKSTGKLYWYGMGSDPLTETDAAGNNPVEYVFFGGKRIARRDSGGTISYYFADHLGTARVVTNATGQILDDSDFYPFGGERIVVSSSGSTYKFTGKERDSESGLYSFPARYYGSNMGRWMSPDPLPWLDWQHGNKDERQKFEDFISNPQNLNLYAYVDNNPLNRTDPTGMLGCQSGDKKFSDCKIIVVYDKDKSRGTLYLVGQNKGDKDPTVLLKTSVVVGGDGHLTPTGTFTATYWEKDHVSQRYGSWADTKWSQTKTGWNVFGPYALHTRELEKEGVYIHGTLGPSWNPSTLGNLGVGMSSHGCVRVCNRDELRLHDMMPDPRGNKVIITTDPNAAPEEE